MISVTGDDSNGVMVRRTLGTEGERGTGAGQGRRGGRNTVKKSRAGKRRRSREKRGTVKEKPDDDVDVGERGEVDVGERGEVDVGERGEVDVGERGEVDVGERGEVDVGERGEEKWLWEREERWTREGHAGRDV
ncbi:hypothetical protein Pcinc_015622 [Petrolisthes cinctipes]|uniref:Uncharacterized protein n=1 Tax=Petrolisthes cinctipes TaxID=88211 RepID=A0AAE1FUG7_PETCI|nr:hypothetical protein Pcinc_015622 [Petrolisthes cinctipes]